MGKPWGEFDGEDHPHREITRAIIGEAIQIQSALGPWLLETLASSAWQTRSDWLGTRYGGRSTWIWTGRGCGWNGPIGSICWQTIGSWSKPNRSKNGWKDGEIKRVIHSQK